MFINSEVLKYAASIIISALSFAVVRSIRSADRCENRIDECEKDIIEIRTILKIPRSRSASV